MENLNKRENECVISTFNKEEIVIDIESTPIDSNTVNRLVNECNADLVYDEIDNAIIFECDEDVYRYSDSEDTNSNIDSDYEELDTGSEPNTVQSAEEICDKISSQLKHVFAQWSVECLISKAAQRKFLRKLRDNVPMLKLPLDPRTIVKAEQKWRVSSNKRWRVLSLWFKTCLA